MMERQYLSVIAAHADGKPALLLLLWPSVGTRLDDGAVEDQPDDVLHQPGYGRTKASQSTFTCAKPGLPHPWLTAP